MPLTLQTLGTLQASTSDAHGTVRTLGRGKPVALLAYLACIPGHRASREHLAALLWGDVDSDAARQNLRQTIWYLKKKLGEGLLDATDELLTLSAPFASDRDEFLQAAQKADFAAAVHRHRGTFIPDFAAPGASEFEQWCELERRRLTVTFLRCADALARQWLSGGKFRDAQELARRARDVDPMDQSTWRLLLEALIAGSDGLGAASEAEHFEAFLASEEQEPEAASLAAVRTARRSPLVRVTSEAGPQATIAAELVGREAEFSRVLGAWDEARTGTPHVICIAAPAGMGKSRLLRDVQARLRASRSRCVLVRANPGDRHMTGGFVAEIVSQLALLPGAAAVSPGSAGVLVALAPALASIYASATPDHSSGEEAVRRRAFALVDLIRAVSDEHPVALLLDDLHWADEQSVRVLAGGCSRLEHMRILVVTTRRSMADPRGLFTPFERLDLPPLDLAAVTSFVAQVAELPSAPWADMLPQQLLLATGGSPLLLVETLHGALEQGWLQCSSDGAWQCADPARMVTSLREGSAVRQRVERLSPNARHGLLALALVGRPIEMAEAVAMMGERSVPMDEALEMLERGGFVARNGTQLVVAHDEIADAVIDSSSGDERQRIHAAIAQHLLASDVNEATLRRAAEHAESAGNAALRERAWRLFLNLRRRVRDRRDVAAIAADLLGQDGNAAAVQALVRATPRWRRRTRWAVAAGTVAVIAATSAGVYWRPAAPPLTADFVFWTVDSAAQRGQFVRVRIDPREPWQAGEPLIAEPADSAEFPLHAVTARDVLVRLPDGKRWWANTSLNEIGEDPVLIDSVGRLRYPMRHIGDDGIAGASPDGRQLVGLTARFDTVTDHMQVVIVDPATSKLTRVTASGENDRDVAWRPDGTQLAFRRRYYALHSADRVCTVDVDGQHERCLNVSISRDFFLAGWLDERRLLIGSADRRLWSLDAATGSVDSIRGIVGHALTNEGQFRVCNCRVSDESEPSFYVWPAADPSAARPVLYKGRPLRGRLHVVATTFAKGEWLDTLRLRLPASGLSIDNVHTLAPEGRRANGAPAWLHDLRWHSRDTTIATVDDAGRLHPKRLGATWIVTSAGGWRMDSALARITPPSSRTVLEEQWTPDWTRRWQPYGIPRPTIVATDRGRALLPNGDGSYPSGAYSVDAFSASTGAGVEADVSLPITATQWQTLQVQLMSSSSLAAFRAWDHSNGPGPTADERCAVAVPGGEGAMALEDLQMDAGGTAATFAVPTGLFAGGWHRLRLQLLEDGRCVLAIDGHAFGVVTSRIQSLPSNVSINLVGHDRFGGRLVVGRLAAWSGVRGGVDWTVLDEKRPGKKR